MTVGNSPTPRKNFSYLCGGLYIGSDLPLPLEGDINPVVESSVTVERCKDGIFPELLETTRAVGNFESYRWGDTWIAWQGNELVSGVATLGTSILWNAIKAANPVILGEFVHFALLPYLLLQRDWLFLHGSAVNIDGKATLFLGPSGVGKSTLAAAHGIRGNRVVADDLVPIIPTSNGVVMTTAFDSRLSLSRQSLSVLAPLDDRLRQIRAEGNDEKTKFIVNQPNSSALIPIERILFLDEDAELPWLYQNRTLAFSDLLRQLCFARYTQHCNPAGHLQVVNRLANQTSVWRASQRQEFSLQISER